MAMSTPCIWSGESDPRPLVSRSLLTVMIWFAIAFDSLPSTVTFASTSLPAVGWQFSAMFCGAVTLRSENNAGRKNPQPNPGKVLVLDLPGAPIRGITNPLQAPQLSRGVV